jgi:hypothetical protein
MPIARTAMTAIVTLRLFMDYNLRAARGRLLSFT